MTPSLSTPTTAGETSQPGQPSRRRKTTRPQPTALEARPPALFHRPSPLLFASEAIRATAEFAAFLAALPMLRSLPRGDGRPVFVLPGFTASDTSTEPMRRLLRQLGYNPFGWELGTNLGPSPKIVDGIFARFDTIRRQTGQPVTLIGWSLGGLYARAIVERAADDVRHVITLGSPIRVALHDQTNAGALFEVINSRRKQLSSNVLRRDGYRGAPAVPSTSVFTKADGVVPWRSCLDEAAPFSENIEVQGSHTGLGHNPAALFVVCDRLRLDYDEFSPFDPSSIDAKMRLLFPAKPFRL